MIMTPQEIRDELRVIAQTIDSENRTKQAYVNASDERIAALRKRQTQLNRIANQKPAPKQEAK